MVVCCKSLIKIESDRCGVLSGSSLPVVKLIKVMVTAHQKGCLLKRNTTAALSGSSLHEAEKSQAADNGRYTMVTKNKVNHVHLWSMMLISKWLTASSGTSLANIVLTHHHVLSSAGNMHL